MNNITLIGMAGAGKTTIGKKLAEALGFEFIDIDQLIKERKRKPLQKTLDELGEEKFSKLEEELVAGLGKITNAVVSPGGSIVYSKKAMEFLKNNSTIIFLDVPLKIIKQRINLKSRAIIGGGEKSVGQIYKQRLPLYRRYADVTIKPQHSLEKNIKDILSKVNI